MHQPSAGESRNPYQRADSLEELLEWHDEDFVRCAYVTILGRRPDRDGEAHYVGLVRAGHSKSSILSALRRSKEGRRHDPGIAGLDRALKRAAWARLPLVGALVRMLVGGESDNAITFRLRRLENELGALKASYSTHGDPVDGAVQSVGGRRQPRPTSRLSKQEQIIFNQIAPMASE